MGFLERHRIAQLKGELGYIDEESGLFVMTETTLRKRGRCCGNGCRHCPYGRSIIGSQSNECSDLILYNDQPIKSNPNILFWSGGKDSYLALLELQNTEDNIVLCTTYANGMVGHQEIPVETIIKQAHHLQLPLLLIALHSNQRYEVQVLKTISTLSPKCLSFGDLHLESIRSWREKYFNLIPLLFPIWNVPYETLLDNLMKANGRAYISAVGDLYSDTGSLCLGTEFTPNLYRKLKQQGIDGFGENGEFHTEVRFW